MRNYAALTHSGKTRRHNEDCFSADADMGLWIVADGVGGHSSGEVASKIACDTIRESVGEGEGLEDAVQEAHQRVLQEISRRAERPASLDMDVDAEVAATDNFSAADPQNNMGTTVVALQLLQHKYQLVWAGDSRAYKWNGKLTQLTTDHSFVGELLAKGVLTKEQAAQHPERHVITQSVGVSADMALQTGCLNGQLGRREQLLMCSDGLTDEVSEALIALEMQQHSTPQQQAEGLLEAALKAGGRDNITIVVIGAELNDGDDPDITQEIAPSHARRGWLGARLRRWRWPALFVVFTALLVLALAA